MNIARGVLEWSDKTFDQVMSDPETKHPMLKAFMCGAAEGLIDGLIINGVVYLTLGTYEIIKIYRKK